MNAPSQTSLLSKLWVETQREVEVILNKASYVKPQSLKDAVDRILVNYATFSALLTILFTIIVTVFCFINPRILLVYIGGFIPVVVYSACDATHCAFIQNVKWHHLAIACITMAVLCTVLSGLVGVVSVLLTVWLLVTSVPLSLLSVN